MRIAQVAPMYEAVPPHRYGGTGGGWTPQYLGGPQGNRGGSENRYGQQGEYGGQSSGMGSCMSNTTSAPRSLGTRAHEPSGHDSRSWVKSLSVQPNRVLPRRASGGTNEPGHRFRGEGPMADRGTFKP